jgi:nucleotide-binding universal stress UspA family protein
MHSMLVPIDGSAYSSRALQHAVSILQQGLKAELHVIHIQPPLILIGEYPEELLRKSQEVEADRLMKKCCKPLDEAGIAYKAHIEFGPVSLGIVEYAKKHKCDHIIMGTRGMGSFGNWIFGSTSSQVIHLADIPVTLVK